MHRSTHPQHLFSNLTDDRMLSRLFSRGKKPRDSRVSARKSKRGENPLTSMLPVDPKSKEGTLASDVVLNNAERQLYRHKMPDKENDMGNMLQAHGGETVFPNVAILDEPAESLEARYRSLTQLQPRVNRRRLDVPDYINLELFKPVEEFSLEHIIQISDKKRMKGDYKYVIMKKAKFILAPLSSFIDNHSDVVVSIVDTRKRASQAVRSLKLQDNKQYRGEFVLDYSFPKVSSGKISLSFAQEVQTFDTGEQWGACQIFLDLEESSFPITTAFEETIGQAAVTTSMMQQYRFHPGHLDLAVRDSHLPELRELYRRGLIVDETEPMHDKVQRAAYAKSGGEALKAERTGKRVVEVNQEGIADWSAVRSAPRALVPAHQASVDPEEDDEEAETTESKIARMNMMANNHHRSMSGETLNTFRSVPEEQKPKRSGSPHPVRFNVPEPFPGPFTPPPPKSESSGDTIPVPSMSKIVTPPN